MKLSRSEKDNLGKSLITSIVKNDFRSVEKLLSQGADPLHEVVYLPGDAPISPLKFVFKSVFEQPFDCDMEPLVYNTNYAQMLLKVTKQIIPADLFEMSKQKEILGFDDVNNTRSISKDLKKYYETECGAMVLSDLRHDITWHGYNTLIEKHGKLAFPKDKPEAQEFGYEWRNTCEENKVGNAVLELLTYSMSEPHGWEEALLNKELWRSPEDVLAYANLSSKNYEKIYGLELPIPAEMFRALNEQDTGTHLGRYLREACSNKPKSQGAV